MHLISPVMHYIYMYLYTSLAAIRVHQHLKNVAMVYSLQQIQVHAIHTIMYMFLIER